MKAFHKVSDATGRRSFIESEDNQVQRHGGGKTRATGGGRCGHPAHHRRGARPIGDLVINDWSHRGRNDVGNELVVSQEALEKDQRAEQEQGDRLASSAPRQPSGRASTSPRKEPAW